MERPSPRRDLLWAHRWRSLARAVGLGPAEPVLLALSGGADSVFLLHVLAGARPRADLRAVTVDHGLRGEESRAEARFCARLCRSLDVPFVLRRAELDPGTGDVESRARLARYRVLAEEARRDGRRTILTGHHGDDALETLLMRWIRGTEAGGLHGPRQRQVLGSLAGEHAGEHPITLVRPLFGMRREEVRRLLRDRGLAWCEDASNRDRRFSRNRVRHDLLPSLIDTCGPEALENLRQFGRAIEELEEAFAASTAHLTWLPAPFGAATQAGHGVPAGGRLERADLMALPSPLRRRALWRLLVEGTGRSLGRRLLELVSADLESGRCARHALPGGWSLRLRSASLSLIPPCRLPAAFDTNPANDDGRQPALPFPGTTRPAPVRAWRGPASGVPWRGPLTTHGAGVPLPIPGSVQLPDGRSISAELVQAHAEAPVPRALTVVELDAENLPPTLWVRWPREGDRFHGLGAPGSKPLTRFLADAGVEREERGLVPLVFDGCELIWVAGVRPCHPRRVGAGTRRRLRLALHRVRTEGAPAGTGAAAVTRPGVLPVTQPGARRSGAGLFDSASWPPAGAPGEAPHAGAGVRGRGDSPTRRG